jgi:hypothetical protein
MKAKTHPLERSIYTSILRDEARHCRFGSLYFEWASERLDDAERHRLADAALSMLRGYAPLWRQDEQQPAGSAPEISSAHAHELGWLEPVRYASLAIGVVRDQIVPDLREIGIDLPADALEALLCGPRSSTTPLSLS